MITRPEEGVDALTGHALRRYWYFPAVLAIALAALGCAYGLARAPVYTASSSLAVGTTNVNTPAALGGFAASAPTLAEAYSRAITAQAVIRRVSSQTGLDSQTARVRLTASAVPETPVIRIDATGPTTSKAMELANVASTALASYAGNLNQTDAAASQILRQYHNAQVELHRARRVAADLPTTADVKTRAKADADVATAKLHAQSLADAYSTSQQGLGASNPLHVLEQASRASSDRGSRIELFALSGIIVGLIVGSAFALLVAARMRSRVAVR